MTRDALSESLRLTLMVAAAVNDADEGQRERLRTELVPVLDQWAHRAAEPDDTVPLYEVLYDIMGADWEPEPAYAVQIAALGGDAEV